ncbi:MAG: tRNA (N6-isopentenyl adenosine(37)-C2)-methylthiotransferase MiaB [Clostridium sp.]|nr:tRNA (N6-isopentenyl adenosine(37)-C2)-methylthiotransferase MiaB [Clostridium sp.]MCM1444614.1 tRNA (N6-isopentenyl adenosine(37)-C2)-methylthiotransferase MiaB [Candidatus Amulumruptor caecigallinarius]
MILPNLKEAKIRTKSDVLVKENEYKITPSQKRIGLNKKYFLKTYGCQMNEHDSENIKAILEDIGFTQTDVMESADIILLNTCAIRENAHNKVFGYLGRIKHLKMYKPDIIVGLCGCMAQEEVVINSILEKYNWLDIVFGTHNIHNLPNILERSIEEKNLNVEVLSIEGDIVENVPVKRDSKYKAWINIMYGCDKFCTYCIVPYTRGKQRSRPPEFIINEINNLIKEGYKEVTLLGQNVNAYGKDLEINYNMANLLEDVSKTGIDRIRFVTSHPWDFTDEMIDVISTYSNIMPYIHLPLQSGSNKILKLMGRRYTKESYVELFNKLKEKIPNVSITTDIIVGFPGETEEDFKDTIDIVNTCKFDSAFTFIFSKRVGTPAAEMKDDITLDGKNKRLYELNELVNKYALINNEKYLNKTVKVLIEGISDKDSSMLMGYTDTMKLVNVKAPIDKIGKIIDVKINDVKTWSMDGIFEN